jgi:hypothetical protein
MSRKLLFAALVAFLCSAIPAHADQVQLSGQPSPTDPLTGLSISPYAATVDGQGVNVFCVDSSTLVANNASWTAVATSLASSSDFANTLQFLLHGSNATALNNYLEMAWLIQGLEAALASNDVTTAAQYQWAIWSFTGGNDPYQTNSGLLSAAQAAVNNNFSVSGWEILTPASWQTGQELIVMATPEPSSSVLLVAGLLLVVLLLKAQKFRAA